MAFDFDPHIRRGHTIVFAFIIVFAIIELSISAWLTARYNSHHNFPTSAIRDRTRFILFASSWTVLFSSLYLILFLHSPSGSILTSVLSHAIFLFMTWVFWLAGAAAITQALGGGLSCGKFDHVTYCGQLNALEGFAWVLFIVTFFALFIVFLRGISATRRGDGLRGQLIA
ncbi:hypothetical protein BKA93DRAFT_767901 [Sparassis latifolia]|uniref:MARVEL domain-containing protein n=1 Tax=Sparassis crispa TaxID=139825 RepID=A0A401G574_9APHY|nr:hypothetical protein SCP_0101860 [Sparassis crispa]GBE77313.1 hypothetical protein SCP_0101860 [Sparassis crispa]